MGYHVRMSSPNPTHQMKFRWPWRAYQQRVLDAIDAHMTDRRLHVVAAPGSGKTTLGLEIFRRLARPAVVLAPTRIIRDQWLARLAHFLPDGQALPPSWASNERDQPGFFTALTYQALHASYIDSLESSPAVTDDDPANPSHESSRDKAPTRREILTTIERFRRVGVGTLLLDEAHHLRAEWWKVLADLVEGLEGVVMVSLTATPPYDVTGPQWQKYQALCGPIDEEISVPELVGTGTLCPHQDFVCATLPTEDERAEARRHDQAVTSLLDELRTDPRLLGAVSQHPWLTADPPDPAEILNDPQLVAVMLSYLNDRHHRPPRAILRLFGLRRRDLPAMDRSRWQVLIDRYLRDRSWKRSSERTEHRTELAKRLRKEKLLHRSELRIDANPVLEDRLAHSAAKLDACVQVHQAERACRGETLRQVVLTDFIRENKTDRLGAWPIFARLSGSLEEDQARRVALITGRLAIIHDTRADRLRQHLGDRADDLTCSPMPRCPGFVRIDRPMGGALVSPLTAMLNEGLLHVLIGTRALLGEGWDAPPVNSLILASYVGSFMLTNQMRGRAIRVDHARPDKSSSIWHLVAVDPDTVSGRIDYETLHRRFAAFVGLNESQPRIENGLTRLHLPRLHQHEDVHNTTQVSRDRLSQIDRLGSRWKSAIAAAGDGRVWPCVDVHHPPTVRPLHTIRVAWATLYLAFWLMIGGAGLTGLVEVVRWPGLFWIAVVTAGLGVAHALPGWIVALWRWIRHLGHGGTLRQMALTVRDALSEQGILTTPRRRMKPILVRIEQHAYSVMLRGGTFYEQQLFADALDEVLAPVDNPRYLVTRRAVWWSRKLPAYHAVPALLAGHKDKAAVFFKRWRRRIGKCQLLYTRSGQGRLNLLQARGRALAAKDPTVTHRSNRWR